MVLVGIGVVWSTPEKEYAPTTTDVAPVIVTTISPVPLGFVRYQNSASLLLNENAAFVSGTPPNVIEATLLLLAVTPTTSSLLVPVPALKLEIVAWYGDDVIVLDVDWTPFKTIEPVPVAADAVSGEDNGFIEMLFVGGTSKSKKMANIPNSEYDFFSAAISDF